ncbi:uncharacterized protein AB9X84_020937 isoform 1-T5 [Acanthopagrus schlegelii]
MGAARGDNRLILSVIILELLYYPFNAHGIKCTVTQSGGVTQYSIPEFNATNCEFWWTNSSDHVLANHMAKLDTLVVNNTNWRLKTNQCVEMISYVRSCTSEGIRMEANCTTSCRGNAENHGVKGPTHNLWIIPTFVSILVVLLVILLYCRYVPAEILHRRHRTPGPNAADEEPQHG